MFFCDEILVEISLLLKMNILPCSFDNILQKKFDLVTYRRWKHFSPQVTYLVSTDDQGQKLSLQTLLLTLPQKSSARISQFVFHLRQPKVKLYSFWDFGKGMLRILFPTITIIFMMHWRLKLVRKYQSLHNIILCKKYLCT